MSRIACITLDLEGDAFWRPEIQCEMFDIPARLAQFREVLEIFGVKLTVFVVGRLMYEQPGYIRALAELGAEFELHSYSHNPSAPDSQEEIERGIEAYVSFFGKRPSGYRAPVGLISPEGMTRLAGAGFQYDSSIVPSMRLDEFRYMNLDKPDFPYWHEGLMELPMAVVPTIRLPVTMSSLKLLGPGAYKLAFRVFGLPSVLVLNSHPYDYFPTQAQATRKGWKRYAHARNAGNAINIFQDFLAMLATEGYQFWHMSQLLRWASRTANLVVGSEAT